MFTISGGCYSDCLTVQIEFEALGWFLQAPDEEIMALATEGWGQRGGVADEIVRFFGSGQTKPMIDYINKYRVYFNPVSFDSHIDQDDAMAWLRDHRPAVYYWIKEHNHYSPGDNPA